MKNMLFYGMSDCPDQSTEYLYATLFSGNYVKRNIDVVISPFSLFQVAYALFFHNKKILDTMTTITY